MQYLAAVNTERRLTLVSFFPSLSLCLSFSVFLSSLCVCLSVSLFLSFSLSVCLSLSFFLLSVSVCLSLSFLLSLSVSLSVSRFISSLSVSLSFLLSLSLSPFTPLLSFSLFLTSLLSPMISYCPVLRLLSPPPSPLQYDYRADLRGEPPVRVIWKRENNSQSQFQVRMPKCVSFGVSHTKKTSTPYTSSHTLDLRIPLSSNSFAYPP